jgi:hypothetical protein
MWGKSRFTSATVTVEADLTLLKEKLNQILPKEKAAANEQEKYDKSFKSEEKKSLEMKLLNRMNRTRHNTRGGQACIWTS